MRNAPSTFAAELCYQSKKDWVEVLKQLGFLTSTSRQSASLEAAEVALELGVWSSHSLPLIRDMVLTCF